MKATKENKMIGVGSVVEIYDFDLDEKSSFTIVSIKTGKPNELSFDCALGKSLLGKTVGEKVVVKADEEYEVEILTVDNSMVQEEPCGGGNGKARITYFQEEFTFTMQKAFYRGKIGFQAYNSKGENVGLVFMCDDKRTPAYEHCELCMYPAYYNQYGEWHRIQSHGGRIKWDKLCEILKQRK